MLFNAWIEVLVEVREEKGLTKEKASAQAGVDLSTWYRWENGKVYPAAHQLPALARGLGIPEDELALRYGRALVRYYEIRVETTLEDPVEADPPAHGLRAIASQSGAMWIDVTELLDKLAEYRPGESKAVLAKRRRPHLGPHGIRKPKRRPR